MKHLGLSFGGTKIVGLFGVAEKLYENGYRPNIISGISAGAILALPLALGKLSELKAIFDNFSHETFMTNSPFKKNGKINFCGVWSLIFNGYLSKQDKIIEQLKKIITKKEFCNWRKDPNRIEVYIQNVNINNGSRNIIKISDTDYEKAMKEILASCSVPIYTDGVFFDNNEFVDGGLRNFILTPTILKKIPGITENISIYSRPEDYKVLEGKADNLVLKLSRIIDIFLVEISKRDEEEEIRIAKELNISSKIYYLPKILKSVYDVDKERLNKLYHAGRNLV